MSGWTGPGAPPIVSGEEQVARDLMERPRAAVKIFWGKDPGAVEENMNEWLAGNPGVEIRQFFPVSVATSVSIAKSIAMAPDEVQMNQCGHSNTSVPNSQTVEAEKSDSVAAVGVYYTYDPPAPAPAPVKQDDDDVPF